LDIAAWLRSLRLEQYEPAFRTNEIEYSRHLLPPPRVRCLAVGKCAVRRTPMIFTSQPSIASILRPTPDRVKTIFLQNPRSKGQEGRPTKGSHHFLRYRADLRRQTVATGAALARGLENAFAARTWADGPLARPSITRDRAFESAFLRR
jgi:hypothetical protein